MTRVDLITLQQIRDAEPADKMQTKHAQQERVYRNTEPRDGFVDDGLVPIDKWGPPTEGDSTLPEPATDAEPFGYWVKYKWTEGQFVRMPAYIAPDGPNNKSTPLYTRSTPARCDELETVAKVDSLFGDMSRLSIINRPLEIGTEVCLRSQAEELLAAERLKLEATAKVGLQLSERVEALEADNKRLREALEPFADVADLDIGDDEDDRAVFWPISSERHSNAGRLRVGDLRRASKALGEGKT